jgi:hypothetical protein
MPSIILFFGAVSRSTMTMPSGICEVAAERLVPKVEERLGHPPEEAYRQQVATEHRQKRAFWERMGRAGLSWRR